ncbi:ion channel [Lipingzhangella sp. LS1_29]|uniref:Ion channel n=1 Tax=Lipingzhangella rawalii TaxID=2055835 RepID=A0ABU2HC34_9ACTN|nr:ion channel [Lipingzhangella rawalii]MDS1272164.1 ion channel [Lipingzhangella rawalii]
MGNAPVSERLARYEARSSPYLLALALAFIVVYGVPVVWPGLPDGLRLAFDIANWAIWGAFAVDLVVRTALAEQRLRFLATHPFDVLVVLVPALRMLRVLRAFTAAQVLVTRSGRLSLLHTTQAIVLATSLLVLIGALALLDAERGAEGATVENFGDALWWSLVTVTTVGYGDVVPATGIGRMVAGGLMLVGISLLGVVTATVASWFLGQTQSALDEQASSHQEYASGVEERLTALEERIENLRADLQLRDGPGSHQ